MTRLTLVTPDAHVGPAAPVAAGLTSAEAQRRLTEFGPNEIRRQQATNALTLLVRQFASPVTPRPPRMPIPQAERVRR